MVLTDFREKIEDLVNGSNLPIDAVYFVLKDVMAEVSTLYNNIATEEKVEIQKKQAEENEARIKAENEKIAKELEEQSKELEE